MVKTLKSTNLLDAFYTIYPDDPSNPEGIRQYFQNIIYRMPNNVYWLNRDCITMGCNKNTLKLIGLERLEDFVGITYEEMGRLAGWTEGQAQSFKADDIEVMEKGEPKLNIEEPPLYDKQGNPVYYLSSRVPLFDREKNVIGVVGISVNITERKMIEEQLRQEKEKAEVASQLKTNFIHNMEHDIRTPFTGIFGIVSSLAHKEEDAKKKKALTMVAESAKELLNYCNRILKFSEEDVFSLPVLDKPFKLDKLIDSIKKMETPAINYKGLQFNTCIEPGVPNVIVGDNRRLERILINLLSNAVKFTEQGYIELNVTLAKTLPESSKVILAFSIKDTGIGFPEDKKDLIYERFVRLTPSNRGIYKGQGLGLTLVKQLINELRGDIQVSTQQGKGTTFVIQLMFGVPLLGDKTEILF